MVRNIIDMRTNVIHIKEEYEYIVAEYKANWNSYNDANNHDDGENDINDDLHKTHPRGILMIATKKELMCAFSDTIILLSLACNVHDRLRRAANKITNSLYSLLHQPVMMMVMSNIGRLCINQVEKS